MHKMISEKQAQYVSNILGCVLTQCEIGPLSIWAPGEKPKHGIGFQWGTPHGHRLSLNLRVKTEKDWIDAIWEPQEIHEKDL